MAGLTCAMGRMTVSPTAGLNLLAEFQPSILKIDMDLVRNIDQSASRRAIVAGIVSICNALNVRVLAEGIETSQERDCLREAGIELMQGYWFCRPAFQSLGTISADAWG